MYADDARDSMPLCQDWHASGGKDGSYNVYVAMTNRPLYKYQGSPEIFRCPADKGDIWREISPDYGDYRTTNCYVQYGNSYLMEWAVDWVRVKHVTGFAGLAGYAGTSMKTSEIALSAANKIVQGDWIWHPNRGWTDRKSSWHNYKGRSLIIFAWGDGHAANLTLPTKPFEDPFWNIPPDPKFTWW